MTIENSGENLLLAERRHYYRNYKLIRAFDFEVTKRVLIEDHGEGRACRFCRRTSPAVNFKSEAHAIPHFLGNNRVFTKNECDSCNALFGREYEDHLAKWSLLYRAVAGIDGKKGVPTFKSKDVRIETDSNGLKIGYQNPLFTISDLDPKNLGAHSLLGDNPSQTYVPLRAAAALIRVACCLCPADLLNQVRLPIEWLLNFDSACLSGWQVMLAFTPGTVQPAYSRVLLLQRIENSESPFLILVLRFRNIRIQTFIPFCDADSNWMRMNQYCKITIPAFPSRFDYGWPFGKTTYGTLDWSSRVPQVDRAQIELGFMQGPGNLRH
jgi:hypothetical protein